MRQRPRILYMESRKALMRERWQKGESLQLSWSRRSSLLIRRL
jgi:hypothetical protein